MPRLESIKKSRGKSKEGSKNSKNGLECQRQQLENDSQDDSSFHDPFTTARPGSKHWMASFIPKEGKLSKPPIMFYEELETGRALNEKLGGQEPIKKIYLVKKSDGLGLRVDAEFTLNNIPQLYPDKTVKVMDSYTQASEKMSVKQFVEEMLHGKRQKLLNLISMEFSHAKKMLNLVQKPKIDRISSIAVKYLEFHKAETIEEQSRVLPQPMGHYFLSSMAGSYTDFHIDAHGSSVWYHILKGRKIFYVVEPSMKNLTSFYNYMTKDKRLGFGDYLPKNSIFRVEIKMGETVFIPSGWIHAVYTPEDSAVVAGNYITKNNVVMQLIVEKFEDTLIEDGALHKSLKFQSFPELNFFIAKEICDDLRKANEDDIMAERHIIDSAIALSLRLRDWIPLQQLVNPNKEHEENVRIISILEDQLADQKKLARLWEYDMPETLEIDVPKEHGRKKRAQNINPAFRRQTRSLSRGPEPRDEVEKQKNLANDNENRKDKHVSNSKELNIGSCTAKATTLSRKRPISPLSNAKSDVDKKESKKKRKLHVLFNEESKDTEDTNTARNGVAKSGRNAPNLEEPKIVSRKKGRTTSKKVKPTPPKTK